MQTKASRDIIPGSSILIIFNIFDNSWAHLTFPQITYVSVKSRNYRIQIKRLDIMYLS